ncbi:MAG: PAS domain-containing protein [Anaerolineae bacterium]|nr:PAS domain-containing protein [Anaerolineae bacterium]
MTFHLQYTPYILPLLAAAFVTGYLGAYAWQRRASPGVAAFIAMMTAMTFWSLSQVMYVLSVDLADQVFWSKMVYPAKVFIALAWLVFALQYTDRSQIVTRRNLILASIIPLLTLLLVFTNEWHGLFWSKVWTEAGSMRTTHGVWFWIHSAYAYLFMLLGMAQYVILFIKSSRVHRWQAAVLVLAGLVPWIGSALFVFNVTPSLDLTTLGFTVSALAFAWGLFRLKLLDLVPVARETIVEYMSSGMVILDAQNRIVDINPAAERMAHTPRSQLIGQDALQWLQGWAGLIEGDQQDGQAEIVLGEGEDHYYYDSHISPLLDRSGHLAGKLLYIMDITERKRIEKGLEQAHKRIEALIIELDQVKKVRQVAEISESEYFKRLQVTARRIRAERQNRNHTEKF